MCRKRVIFTANRDISKPLLPQIYMKGVGTEGALSLSTIRGQSFMTGVFLKNCHT